MPIRVFIATTEGPVAVERITREPAAQSAVCVKRTTRVLPISAAYDAFVRAPSGVIEREFGPWDRGAFRLDVSAPVSDGESWQLGVFIAHALAAENQLAGPEDDASQALWITGAVDSDLGVGTVGHVAEKLHASADLIAEHQKSATPLQFFVPEGNLKSMTGHTDIMVTAVTSARDIQRHLGLLEDEKTDLPVAMAKPAPTLPPAPTGNGLRTIFTVLSLGILVTGAGAFVYLQQQPVTPPVKTTLEKPAPTPEEIPVVVVEKTPVPVLKTVQPAPAKGPEIATAAFAPTLQVFELRAKGGGSCAAIQFSQAKPERILLKSLKNNELPDTKAKGLCGLEYVVAVGPEQRYVAASLNLTRGRFVRGRSLPETLRGNIAVKGTLSWRTHIPKKLPRPVQYTVSVAISKTPISGPGPQTLTAQHKVLSKN